MKIDKSGYSETIALSQDVPNTNWQLLLEEAEKTGQKKPKKKKK